MKVVSTGGELKETLLEYAGLAGRRVLVPTMGALHHGHLELVKHARQAAGPGGTVVGWIFVNPIQFDRAADLDPSRGPTGAELPSKLLATLGDTLAPGGRLYLPTGGLQDEQAILSAARAIFGDNMERVMEREFPLPDLVAKAAATARLMKEGLLNLHKRGSRLLWSLRIWRCVRS